MISRWSLSPWNRRLQSWLERPVYVFAVTGVSALNAFLPFFPIELFLTLRVLRRPGEWWRLALLAALASLVANAWLAHLVESQSLSGLAHWLETQIGQGNWERVSQFARLHGSLGLTLISLSLLPLPPAVIVCALAGVPLLEIAMAIGLGHSLKYGFFSWLAAHSPRWIGKLKQGAVSS